MYGSHYKHKTGGGRASKKHLAHYPGRTKMKVKHRARLRTPMHRGGRS